MRSRGPMNLAQEIDRNGFAVVEGVLEMETTGHLIAELEGAAMRAGIERRGSVMAMRNLFEEVPDVAVLARSPSVRGLAEEVLGSDCFAVRGVLFDKTPEANWKVTWHQDLAIAVREPREVAGFGPWSEKAGVPHVLPPAEVLERMITVRLHLDPCGTEHGPVRVIAGSHREGRLAVHQADHWRELVAPTECVVGRGGALVMRPLLLHASSPATMPAHRRVLHLEFAVDDLPGGLEWHGRW